MNDQNKYEHLLPEGDRFPSRERILAEAKEREENYNKYIKEHQVTVGQLKEFIANLPDDYVLHTYSDEYSTWDTVLGLTYDDDTKSLRFHNWEVE